VARVAAAHQGSGCPQATYQKREVAHPQLAWSTLKNILALCFPVKVAHPRGRLVSLDSRPWIPQRAAFLGMALRVLAPSE
jgi:hypothetical protein